MKDIRIFVASSKELIAERNALAYLVLSNEEEFAARGFRVRLSKWEYVDPTMTEERTEDRYLDEMYNCDAVLMLFRHVLGKYTKEEVDKAIAAEEAGTSRIKKHLILFKEGDADESPELAAWRASLADGTYGTFTDAGGLGEHFMRLVEEIAGLSLQDVADAETEKTISAFLAVDDELAVDRDAFADAVLNLNDVLSRRGVRVRLRFYDPGRHRDMLDSSEMALVLYQTKCGEFGGAALKEAYDRSKQDQNPRRLYVFFRDASGRPLDDDFQALKEGFAETFGSAPCRFENVDTLSLNFLFALESMLGDGAGTFVKLDGRTVVADGLDVGDLTKLPMLAKNEGLAELFSRMADVSKRFVAQRGKCEKEPQDDGLYVELLDISAEKNRLQDQIDRELKMSFNLAKRMAAVAIAQTNETIARARAKMEEGKIKEALEILDGASAAMKRRRLLHRAADRAEAEELQIKELKASAEIEYFRVDAIMAYTAMPFRERVAKATIILKNLVDDIGKFLDFVTFKGREKVLRLDAEACEKLALHYKRDKGSQSDAPMKLLARAWKEMEEVSSDKSLFIRFRLEMFDWALRDEMLDLAESILKDAQEEWDACPAQDRNRSEMVLLRCRILKDFAKLYSNEGKHEAALEAVRTAVDLAKVEDVKDSPVQQRDYFTLLMLHGRAAVNCACYDESKKAFSRALSVGRRCRSHLLCCTALESIGDLSLAQNETERARECYVEAIAQVESCWTVDPNGFSDRVGSVIPNLLRTFKGKSASDICAAFEKILVDAPVGLVRKALQQINLKGQAFKMMGKYAEARKLFEFSYSKAVSLVKNGTMQFQVDVAGALRHLAEVHMQLGELEAAVRVGSTALKLRRAWDPQSLWIATLLRWLSKASSMLGDSARAEEFLKDADAVRSKLKFNSRGLHILDKSESWCV